MSFLGKKDAKIAAAEKIVSEMLNQGYNPICFCRFIATSDYVAEELAKRLAPTFPDLRVNSVTSSLSDEERQILVEDLTKHKGPVVMVATDCLSEGLSLQDGFNAVVHYDLPWNPNRLEQREGRVDRFGQVSRIVKAVLLYGADNPIDAAVLDVLLRKARKIHKTLGITVPIPTDSEGTTETLLQALFIRGGEKRFQMDSFDDKSPVREFEITWDRAVQQERTGRTRFAQRAIKPEEVAQELEKTDEVLGSPHRVEHFVRDAAQRLGAPLKKNGSAYNLDSSVLPEGIKSRLSDMAPGPIAFEVPCPDASYVSRDYPLTEALAEYLLDQAMDPSGNRITSARLSVIRSRDVKRITTLLLLRNRYIVEAVSSSGPTMAEETVVAGFEGTIGDETWLNREDAKRLMDSVQPSSDLSKSEKEHWAEETLKDISKILPQINDRAEARALELKESHEKLRQAIKGRRVSVQPTLPPDVLAISLIIPQPKI